MKRYADLFKALSDETRLRIIILLCEGELCVCQIEWALGLPQAKVSRHLTVLRHAGLVKAKREGLWAYYSLEKQGGGFEKSLIEAFKSHLCGEAGFREDLVKMRKCVARPQELTARDARKL